MNIQYNEEDRIEHIKGVSHCRCKNKRLKNGKNSCDQFDLAVVTEKSRKYGLKQYQQCAYSTDQGYCHYSRLDEIAYIKSKGKFQLPLIAHRITTEEGIKLLQESMRL